MSGSLPKLIDGGLSVDDRGTVTFVNDFDFKDVKRFYMVENHNKGFVRAWHGHVKEAKYVLVVQGSIILGIKSFGDRVAPERYVLSASKPRIVYIPPLHFNGFKTLTDDAKVVFFSTSTLEESLADDVREPATKWNKIWKVEER